MTYKVYGTVTSTYWADKRVYNIYNYDDGIDLANKQVQGHYAVNVPCYSVDDMSQLIDGSKSFIIYDLCQQFKHYTTIQTNNHRGKTFYYLLATPETQKFVNDQTVFSILKQYISKPIKLHHKVVSVIQRGRQPMWNGDVYPHVDCYIQQASRSKQIQKIFQQNR